MEIVQDDELLHRFSKKDIRTLTYLACNYQSRPKVEIDSVSFSTKLNRLIFSIFKGSKKQKQEQGQNKTEEDLRTAKSKKHQRIFSAYA